MRTDRAESDWKWAARKKDRLKIMLTFLVRVTTKSPRCNQETLDGRTSFPYIKIKL